MGRGAAVGLALWTGVAAAAEPSPERERAERADAAWQAWPQDYAAAIEAGRAWLDAGRPADAVPPLRAADALSGGAPEARDLLAWALLGTGRAGEARRTAADPEVTRAARFVGRPWRVAADVAFAAASGWDDAGTTWALGVRGRWIGDAGAVVQLGYRYGRIDYRVDTLDPITGLAVQTAAPADEHQVTAGLGFASPRWALVADGLVAVTSNGLRAGGASLTARASPFGDVVAHLSWAAWDDVGIGGLELSWSAPAGPVRIVPGLEGQLVDGAPLGSATLAFVVDRDGLGGWVGGRYGKRRRPWLAEPVAAVDLPGTLTWGVTAGLRTGVLGAVRLDVGYALDALELAATDTIGGAPDTALLHGVVLTLTGLP